MHSAEGIGNSVSNVLSVVVDVFPPAVEISAGRTELDPVFNALVTRVTFTFSESVTPTNPLSKLALTRVDSAGDHIDAQLSLTTFDAVNSTLWIIGVRATEGMTFGLLLGGGAASDLAGASCTHT